MKYNGPHCLPNLPTGVDDRRAPSPALSPRCALRLPPALSAADGATSPYGVASIALPATVGAAAVFADRGPRHRVVTPRVR